MTAKIEYTYTYEEGKISRAAQCAITGTNLEIAHINPFRYRSYTYDQEIEMYYLQSRYYDPVVGRFINADNPSQKTSEIANVIINSFSYCSNSVVMLTDPDGYKARRVVGYGIQIMINLHMLVFNFFFGAELIWYNKNYGKHKKVLLGVINFMAPP